MGECRNRDTDREHVDPNRSVGQGRLIQMSLTNPMSEPLAPRMVRWSGLGMRLQEMVQDMQQGHHMLLVASGELGLPNIVDNHVQHFFTAVFLGQEVGSECCCSDFGEVFVLCDGKHLLFGQAA